MFIFKKEQKKTNYGKIIAITLAVVGGVCAVAFVVYKLFQKFFSCCECDCGDELLDECECDCDDFCDDEEEEKESEACCCGNAADKQNDSSTEEAAAQ